MATTTPYSHPVMRERRVQALAAMLYARSDVLGDRDEDRHAILTTDCFRAANVFMKEADERMAEAAGKGFADLDKATTSGHLCIAAKDIPCPVCGRRAATDPSGPGPQGLQPRDCAEGG